MHEFLDHLLRTWRDKAGISQTEAAKRLGISRTFYRDLETGRRVAMREDDVQHIADALNMDTDRIECACGRIPADVLEHLAGNYRAIQRVRMLEGLER